MRRALLPCLTLGLLLPLPVLAGEIVTLTNENWERYAPPGKEADCILGDYVLKNDRVWAVVAQPAPWRNANMTVKQVGGAVIDLTTTERPNDQLSAFYPGMRRNSFDKAEIVAAFGKKVVLVLTAPPQAAKAATKEQPGVPAQAAVAAQPAVQLTYELTDGQPYLVVKSTFTNPGDSPLEFSLEDDLRADNFDSKARNGIHEGRDFFFVHDRHFQQAYGILGGQHRVKSQSDTTRLSRLEYLAEGAENGKVTLAAGQSHELVRWLIPGANYFAVQREVMLRAGPPVFTIICHVCDQASNPVVGAEVALKEKDVDLGSGRTDAAGNLVVPVHGPGKYDLTARAVAQGSLTQRVEVEGPKPTSSKFVLPIAPQVSAEITDEKGGPIPCKVQFKGLNGTPNPNWGPVAAQPAVTNLYYTPNGRFTTPIGPGEYEAIISCGPEYDVERVPLKVEKAGKATLKATLTRAVHSPGWVSADFHSHSSPSGDNTSDQRGRVLNLLAEHIEFAPCTEHNRIDSYLPHLKALGVERLMGTCTGIELTGQPLPLNHQNAFPLRMKPRTQDNGAPLTDLDPQKQIRRIHDWDDKGEKLIQQNHPDIGWLFFDKDGDGSRDPGYVEGFAYMQVIEVHPIHQVLDMKPTRIVATQQGKRETRNETIFNWLQLLNQGYRIPGVVNTDAHYNFHGSGGLRNWVRCDTAVPGKIDPLDIVRHARQGHLILSTGPYLEVKLGDAQPGDEVRLQGGKGTMQVRVQCPNWLDIDRVQVLVNGRPDPRYNFTRQKNAGMFGTGVVKFDQKINLSLEADAHLIVVAMGEESVVGEVMGPQWGRQKPTALSNPIFADVDGGGFKPNGDTLDAPLPVKEGKAAATETKP